MTCITNILFTSVGVQIVSVKFYNPFHKILDKRFSFYFILFLLYVDYVYILGNKGWISK